MSHTRTPHTDAAAMQSDPQVEQSICKLAFEMVGTERGRDAWLAQPNPELSGKSPNNLIASGHAEVVLRYLKANVNGDFG